MSIEIVGGIVIVAIGCFGILQAIVVHYVAASTEQKIHRWLADKAREVSEDVADIMGEPLGSDYELLGELRSDRMQKSSDQS